MKTLLFLILISFSGASSAATCQWSWTASISKDVVSYSLYKGTEPIVTDITGLTYDMPCVSGSYSVTATNSYGIESVRSKTYKLKRPKAGKGLTTKRLK